ncbi:SDR family NAD(P)-dependent oxidoreductase [Calidifontibacter sp. DB0510]|uniref:SDR family NAD(P)-dependent oxidoreductase n=1 Tax=Metallococcus carri TaxID=1656884 RepID=A0A967B014_9MICO|nr:SDR family NAD(P)-dependent oxidoreductase [Metallococcus carri]NHN55567.1 SDR family NAD(P)-dependent oxidoreductase [Metallococcus carri]NOP38249.1 SDR family NAD(P)-dependent oxidoreductase [Calidifontibacter sp. DB2511S]
MSLDGAVVVVTGASGALGASVVDALLARGATVVTADRSAGETSGRVQHTTIDLLDEEATRAWGRQIVADHGRVDGLLHLVGGWKGGKGIVESDLADWNVLHDSLIRTLQHASRALHDAIAASPDGRLAIVSSVSVESPTATNASYAAAKAAAEAWTRAVADSFARSWATASEVSSTGSVAGSSAADSVAGPSGAAAIVRVMALLTPAMREKKPKATFAGFTPVDEVAQALVGLWDRPAAEVNGTILDLTPKRR